MFALATVKCNVTCHEHPSLCLYKLPSLKPQAAALGGYTASPEETKSAVEVGVGGDGQDQYIFHG